MAKPNLDNNRITFPTTHKKELFELAKASDPKITASALATHIFNLGWQLYEQSQTNPQATADKVAPSC